MWFLTIHRSVLTIDSIVFPAMRAGGVAAVAVTKPYPRGTVLCFALAVQRRYKVSAYTHCNTSAMEHDILDKVTCFNNRPATTTSFTQQIVTLQESFSLSK
jgi:hypothetical protein